MTKKLPDVRWIIEVHMDSLGPEREIRILSLERVRAVLEYFVVLADCLVEDSKSWYGR